MAPDVPARRPIDRAALKRVLARAAELQARAGDDDAGLSEAQVIDLATGKQLDDKAIEAADIKIVVPGTTDVPAIKWGEHGGKPPTDAFWSTWWTVPDKQPTGVLPWTISVKAGV